MRRLALPVVLLVGALTLLACSGDSDTTSSEHGSGDSSEHEMGGMEQNRPVITDAPEIQVTANALTFEPKRLRLTAGEGVNVALKSVDLEHDLFVDGVGHIAHAEAGETTTAGLRIEEAGTYRFWCTVEGHKAGGMVGTITVS